ncbi:hypothetical protein VHEMI07111 [[Torrubiella] hemipterigena]|uniref:SMP-LTD domain-containing protein n=1 Tax=[Torrubiella] hemipterigena TaxID=1531966 RepID=A0A0A1TKQ0_9HYPO|nr:hypothetical protein VHEMI07111 [[Torrubiella] hemipterigena]
MGYFKDILLAYFVGGVTFIPLVIIAVLAHAHYTFPHRHDVLPLGNDETIQSETKQYDEIVEEGDNTEALDAARANKAEALRAKAKLASQDIPDVAAGFFAVCREYTPMGINAKPIERSTPVGSTTVASPSPSVYQTMYRSIFDRKAAPNGPIEGTNMSQRPKRAGNVFYVVLRHGHLMLFDDEEQLEVRHVISLAHHDISIYSGGDVTPEGELFIKRNALCLSRRVSETDNNNSDTPVSKPFYLFSENCSAKEDFYFALLRNQEQTFSFEDRAPKPKQFDVKAIISLVQKLHSSEDNIHSRWINAMIGRVFLGVYETRDIQYLIAEKITKKISRVKTPSFLTNIAIRRIDTGTAAPYFSNMKLKDLTVEGECVMEADVRYTGNFRLEVAATAKIDLGTRFKAREVNLVLSVMLKRIEGHVLFKIKPPPSNRIWFSFQTMPKMEMTIEPIVSSRQITYTVILRQIENRIKEVVAETLVQPFWDDIPFFRTEHKRWRGGIFEGDDAVNPTEDIENALPPLATETDTKTTEPVETKTEDAGDASSSGESTTVQPLEATPVATGLFGRKLTNKNGLDGNISSASVDSKGSALSTSRSPNIVKNAVEPVVATEAAHSDLFKPSSPPDRATSFMAALQSRARDSPLASPVGSPEKAPLKLMSSQSSTSSKDLSEASGGDLEATPTAETRRNTASSLGSTSGEDQLTPAESASGSSSFQSQTGSLGRNFFMKRENTNSTLGSIDGVAAKRNTLAAMSNAAAQAKQWGWNAIQRQKEARRNAEAVDLTQPMGRGQPLPPPGVPLPGPVNGRGTFMPPAVPQRKNESPPLPERRKTESHGSEHEQRKASTPVAQRRRRGTSLEHDEPGDQPMLIVAIPDESEPSTPLKEDEVEILGSVAPAEPVADLPVNPAEVELPKRTAISGSSSPMPIKASSGARQRAEMEETLASTPDSAELAAQTEPIVALPAADLPPAADIDDDFSPWLEDNTDEDVPAPLAAPADIAHENATDSKSI